jgi:hypothetical protein
MRILYAKLRTRRRSETIARARELCLLAPNRLSAEILEAFLRALHGADPNQPGLSTRLYRAASQRAHKVCKQERHLTRHLD